MVIYMKKVVLVHTGHILHYRVSVYNYISNYLKKRNFLLIVVSSDIEKNNPHDVLFQYIKTNLCYSNLKNIFLNTNPDAVILWLGPHLYILPLLFFLKRLNIKIIHWGHRQPWPPFAFTKKIIYNLEHCVDDAIILYSENFKKYVFKCFHHKSFVANNTLNMTTYKNITISKEKIKNKYGIVTNKNIICMGRMQKRKKIDDLIKAFSLLNIADTGLILVGPDPDEILKNVNASNIYKFGPIYGQESFELLSISDVYCLPGHIGLSIVDAFYCGLPVVTENVIHAPEIMYLKDGINGFMVKKGDIDQMVKKLRLLIIDDKLRNQFSLAAKEEITTIGHIDRMCEGFAAALFYVCK